MKNGPSSHAQCPSSISREWAVLYLAFAFAYSVSVWFGLYGFGNDYYAAYWKSNLSWGGLTDVLGWRISTLTIFDVHLGVLITSSVIAVSLFVLISQIGAWSINWRSLNGLLIFLLFLHTWPVVMSNSNAMRQGLMMSGLWLGLASFDRGATKLGLGFCVLAIFLHNAGWYYSLLLVGAWWLSRVGVKSSFSRSRLWIERTLGILFFVFAFYLGSIVYLNQVPLRSSRVIGLDLRWFFLLTSLSYVGVWLFWLKGDEKFQIVFLFLFLVMISSPVILLAGYNWEYERINMIVSIPLFLAIVGLLPRRIRSFGMLIVSGLFVFATIAAGLFGSLR